eukprot:scaffold34267_cov33-Phaeocystis_antarctica.AAC.1
MPIEPSPRFCSEVCTAASPPARSCCPSRARVTFSAPKAPPYWARPRPRSHAFVRAVGGRSSDDDVAVGVSAT